MRSVYLIRDDLQVAARRRLEREHSLRVVTVVHTDECAVVASFARARVHLLHQVGEVRVNGVSSLLVIAFS